MNKIEKNQNVKITEILNNLSKNTFNSTYQNSIGKTNFENANNDSSSSQLKTQSNIKKKLKDIRMSK